MNYAIRSLTHFKSIYGQKWNSEEHQVGFGYDVSCMLKKALINRGLEHLLPNNLFVPEMHAMSHVSSCQLEFAPWLKISTGRICGEQCEETWSQLRLTAPHTTVMRPEKRQDSINIFLEGVAEIKYWGAVGGIKRELSNCIKIQKELQKVQKFNLTETISKTAIKTQLIMEFLNESEGTSYQNGFTAAVSIASQINRNRFVMKRGVGTQIASSLSQKNCRLNEQLRKGIDSYNARNIDHRQIRIDDVMKSAPERVSLVDKKLSNSILWHQYVFQMQCSLQSLKRLIRNVDSELASSTSSVDLRLLAKRLSLRKISLVNSAKKLLEEFEA